MNVYDNLITHSFSLRDFFLNCACVCASQELIPEFFCGAGDFLTNSQDLELGYRTSTGEKVNDVILPPWAKDSPRSFIRQQAKALESDYGRIYYIFPTQGVDRSSLLIVIIVCLVMYSIGASA